MKTNVYLTVCIIALSLPHSFGGIPGRPKWASPLVTSGAVNGSAAISADGQTIYITSEDGNLYAIDPTTGQNKPNWPVQLGNVRSYDVELISSPVIAANGSIYVASTDGNLYNINPNGSQNWSLTLNPGGGLAGASVAIGANGIVYVTYDDTIQLFAVDPTGNNGQGTVMWAFDASHSTSGFTFIDSSPSVGPDGTIYFYGGFPNVLVAVGCAGNLKWTFPLEFASEDADDFQYTLVIDWDGTIYVPYGASADTLAAVRPDGTLKWLFATATGLPITSSPAIGADGTLYFGAGAGLLYAVNSDGTLKWSFDTQTQAPIISSPVVASDGTIYLGCSDGRLWAVNDYGPFGYLKWTFPSLFSEPALGAPIISSPVISADNVVYFGCANNNVYAVYSETGSLAEGAWPMFRKNPTHQGSQNTTYQTTIGVTLDGPQTIYKGYTGFGTTYSGYTWFTISRPCPGPELQVTFFLGGDGTTQSPVDNTIYALRPQDFTASGANTAPFPNGYYFTMQSGQTQQTIGVQTVDGNHVSSEQLLLLTIPPQTGITPDPNATQATAYIDDPDY